MNTKRLVILAAGMGSRYGGLKQMDPIGPHGEFLLDYSIRDALAAGFQEVVFVIRHDLEADFRRIVGDRWEARGARFLVYGSLHGAPPSLLDRLGLGKRR